MDNTELHYISFDPDEIWSGMIDAYIDKGGDVLYPGDEKEMLLRGVQEILVRGFAAVDNALKMAVLDYAVGGYLDAYGSQRGCERLEAVAAQATVSITKNAGAAMTIPKGTRLTADGAVIYEFGSDIYLAAGAGTTNAGIVCSEAGSIGNGLTAGTYMQMMVGIPRIAGITVLTNAGGGLDEEGDEEYRERIRTHGLANLTTGPAVQYETAAKAVTVNVADAKAVNGGAGIVNVYLILHDPSTAASDITKVVAALNDQTVRPLTDTVNVAQATAKTYTLKLEYQSETDISADVSNAVAEYLEWQNFKVGRAFNPDKLMSAVYRAGAERVVWGAGSSFDGGDVEYTEIGNSERCSGTVTIQ